MRIFFIFVIIVLFLLAVIDLLLFYLLMRFYKQIYTDFISPKNQVDSKDSSREFLNDGN